eukprot:14258539-Ditylum_brightwellii.AAC.1
MTSTISSESSKDGVYIKQDEEPTRLSRLLSLSKKTLLRNASSSKVQDEGEGDSLDDSSNANATKATESLPALPQPEDGTGLDNTIGWIK